MRHEAFVQCCSAVHPAGIFSTFGGKRGWEEGQRGPQDIKRSQVFDQPLPEFGKLQIADRLAFCAASLIFREVSVPGRAGYGISLGTAFGSLFTDIRYMESVVSGFPRPAYFSATLPSSPVAELAIRFGLTGPDRVVAGGFSPGLSALDAALSMLKRGKAPGILVTAISAVDRAVDISAFVAPQAAREAFSYACLLTAGRLEGGLNFRLALDGEFCNATVARHADESYFLEMTEASVRGEGRRIPVSRPDFTGTIHVIKD